MEGLLTALLLLATGALDVEGAVRSEVRARASDGGDGLSSTGDLAVNPGVTLRLGRESTLSLAYQPQLWLPVWGQAGALRVLHQGQLEGLLVVNERVRLTLRERAAYGQQDFSVVAQAQQEGALQPVPGVTTLRYQLSETTGTLQARLDPRATLDASAAWVVSGGADATSRISLPLQRGPTGSLSLAAALSRRDTLTSALSASHASFGTGVQTTVAAAQETWTRLLPAGLTGRLGLGVGATLWSVPDAAAPGWSLLPVGELGLSSRLTSSSVDLGAAARLAPFVDRLTGEAYERAEGTLSAGWAPLRDWTLGLRATGGVVAWGTRGGDRVGAVEAGAAWTLPSARGDSGRPALNVALALRAAQQTGTYSYTEFGAALSLTATLRERLW